MAAFQMMRLPVYRQSQVVAGGGRVEEFLVDVVGLSHGQGAVDDHAGMVFPVRLVKGCVAGDDLALNVLLQGFSDHVYCSNLPVLPSS